MTAYITLLAAETVAELSWRTARDKRWDYWYDPDKWNGITGFYGYVIGIAQDLEAWVNNNTLEWGEDIDWYLTCDNLVEGIFNKDHISVHNIKAYVHFEPHRPEATTVDELEKTIQALLL